ncbi:alpha/beta hydrolase [uncultured Paraglaciecola sp.]|uniref:alpha/beta fold hydrolase n=1 Tax=uncultured Paraglaciecola sp. TaxID=1765024 RepID=UPI0030DC1B0E
MNSYAQEKIDNDGVVQQTLAPLPSHWQQSRINEPIFGGVVHVIDTGQKHKKAIILVHGLGYSGLRDWVDIIPQLESDYHIIALDLPGFGESDPTSLQLAPQRYAQLLKWLIPQFSSQKVTVVGHSMGGAISLRFASEFPDMVERLVMVDTAGVLQRSVFVRHMTEMPDRYEWLAKYQQRFNIVDTAVSRFNRFINRVSGSVLNQLDKLPDPTLVLLQNDYAQKYVYKDRPTLNAAIGLINENFSQAIDKLLIPTHIIWGEYDRVAPLRTGELLQHHIANAELHVIQEAGHVPMKDQPTEFMLKLNYALNNPPKKHKDSHYVKSEPLPTLTCNNQNDRSYSGHYAFVYISGCQYITLTDLSAEQIYIENSDVTMQQVDVESDSLTMEVNNSFVTMTNVRVHGETALKVKDSTVDAAGTEFSGSNHPIQVVADSLIYLSVSQHNHNGKLHYLHGMSEGNSYDLR